MEENIKAFANIVVPIDEYNELKEKVYKYKILLNAILGNAKLSYSEDELNFSDYSIDYILKAIEPLDYMTVVEKLREDKENKDESVD